MDQKLYDLMNWTEVEEIVYSESENPHAILGPHLREEGLLIRQRLSQEDLGKRIGTSRVTVNKLLGELEQEGLLHRTGQRLILDDISGLEMELKNPERTRSRK